MNLAPPHNDAAAGTIAVAGMHGRELPPAPRIEAVDGLRGFAALVVLLFHVYGEARAPDWRAFHGINLLRPLHDGWAGVNLFLVLSGFCLYWPFVTQRDRVLHPRSYAMRRVWRIVPAYYSSLAFVSLSALLWPTLRAISADALPKGSTDFVLHLTLLHSLTASTISSWNSVTWSLGLEWTWYMLFPFTLWLYRKVGANRGFLCLAAVTLAYRGTLYVCFRSSALCVNEDRALRTFILGRLFEFGLGMWVAWQVHQPPGTGRWLRWAPLGVVVLLVAAHVATPTPTLLPTRDILYGSASALLLLAATSPTENWVRRLFSARWLCWIGLFSYTLYLFHLPMLVMLRLACAPLGLAGLRLFFFLLTCSVLIVPLCWLIFQVVEKPFLRAKPTLVKKELA